MKKFLCLIFALLLPSSNFYEPPLYYTCVIFQNQQMYEEYMSRGSLHSLIDDFHNDSNLESIYITRDL